MNEKKYGTPTKEDIDIALSRPWNCDIDTVHGRQEFEAKMSKVVIDYPGMMTPEGDKFDFKAFYAAYATLIAAVQFATIKTWSSCLKTIWPLPEILSTQS
jgi:hypothetical protein